MLEQERENDGKNLFPVKLHDTYKK
jgi:hypothetical protein